MIFSLVVVCLGIPTTLCMRWLNLKVVAANRKKQRLEPQNELDSSTNEALDEIEDAGPVVESAFDKQKA